MNEKSDLPRPAQTSSDVPVYTEPVTPTVKKRPDLALMVASIAISPVLVYITAFSIGIRDQEIGEVGFNPLGSWLFLANGIVFWIGAANRIINKRKILLYKDATLRQILVYIGALSLAVVPFLGYTFQKEWVFVAYVITVFSFSLLTVTAFSRNSGEKRQAGGESYVSENKPKKYVDK